MASFSLPTTPLVDMDGHHWRRDVRLRLLGRALCEMDRSALAQQQALQTIP